MCVFGNISSEKDSNLSCRHKLSSSSDRHQLTDQLFVGAIDVSHIKSSDSRNPSRCHCRRASERATCTTGVISGLCSKVIGGIGNVGMVQMEEDVFIHLLLYYTKSCKFWQRRKFKNFWILTDSIIYWTRESISTEFRCESAYREFLRNYATL